MPTYTIVSSTQIPLGPNEIWADDYIPVSDGDVYIIGPTADVDILFENPGASPVSFSIEVLSDNPNNLSIEVDSGLNATITFADGVSAPDMEVDGRYADSVNLTIGNDVEMNDIKLGYGNDTVTIGDGVIIDDLTDLGGNDSITIGDDFVADRMEMGPGDDTVSIGENAVTSSFDGGLGTDTLETKTPAYYLEPTNFETVTYVCYATGTRIETPKGPVPVEQLQAGDQVVTLDRGAQPILWMRHSLTPLSPLAADQRPVLISGGALGQGIPARDLIVSPHHRILVGGRGQLTDRFRDEVFAPAKALTHLPGIRHMAGKREIAWVHFACRQHEVVLANGCLAESLLLGTMALRTMTPAERAALLRIFAPQQRLPLNGPAARVCLPAAKARQHLRQFRPASAG